MHEPFLDGYGRILGLAPAKSCVGTNRIMNQTLVCIDSHTGSPCQKISMPSISAIEDPVLLGYYDAPVIRSTRIMFLDKNSHYWTADIPESGVREPTVNMSVNRLLFSTTLDCWTNPNLVQSTATVAMACFGGSGVVYGFNVDGQAWITEGVALTDRSVPAFLPRVAIPGEAMFPGGVFTGKTMLDLTGAATNVHPDMTSFLAAMTVSNGQAAPLLYQISTGSSPAHQRLQVVPLSMTFNGLQYVSQVSKASWGAAEPAILRERGGWILAVTRGRSTDTSDDTSSPKDSSFEIRVFKSILEQKVEITKSTMLSWLAVGCRQLLDASLVDDAGTVLAVVGCDTEFAVVTIPSPWTRPVTSATLPRSRGTTAENDASVVGMRGGMMLLATSMQDGACSSQTVPASLTALVLSPLTSPTPFPSSGPVPFVSSSATPSANSLISPSPLPTLMPRTKEFTVIYAPIDWFYAGFSRTFANQSQAFAFARGALGLAQHAQDAALGDDQTPIQDDQTIWQDDNSAADDSNDFHRSINDDDNHVPSNDNNGASNDDNNDLTGDDRHFDDALVPGAESINVCISSSQMRIDLDTVVNGRAETFSIARSVSDWSEAGGVAFTTVGACNIRSTSPVPAHIYKWCSPSVEQDVAMQIALVHARSNTVANTDGILMSIGSAERSWHGHWARMMTTPVTNLLPRVGGACVISTPTPTPSPSPSVVPHVAPMSPIVVDILGGVGGLVLVAGCCLCMASRSGARPCCGTASKTPRRRPGRAGRGGGQGAAGAYAMLPDAPAAASGRRRQAPSASLNAPRPLAATAVSPPPPGVAAAMHAPPPAAASAPSLPFSLATATAPPPPTYDSASLDTPGASAYAGYASATAQASPHLPRRNEDPSQRRQPADDFVMEL
jgi:hypothetical protein